jgi:membrane-associated phospholipid phosphatase
MRLQSKEYQHFRTAIVFSLVVASVLAVFIAIYGKNESFLMINGHYSVQADYFFNWVTLLGEWISWVPLFAYALFYQRRFLIAVVVALLVCTLLIRLGKNVIFEGQPRPLRLLQDAARGVPLLKHNRYVDSFPSGHTSTAFTTAMLLAYAVRRRWAPYFFILVAFLVGYSRVYLAQHFVTDVLAGIIVGVISSYLGLVVYDAFLQKKKLAASERSP